MRMSILDAGAQNHVLFHPSASQHPFTEIGGRTGPLNRCKASAQPRTRVSTGPKMKAEFCFFFWRLDFLLFSRRPTPIPKTERFKLSIFSMNKIISPDQQENQESKGSLKKKREKVWYSTKQVGGYRFFGKYFRRKY